MSDDDDDDDDYHKFELFFARLVQQHTEGIYDVLFVGNFVLFPVVEEC